MTPDEAQAFLAARHRGVLATLTREGRPQLSNIVYVFVDGQARISVTETRAKTANARRDPRVSLHVTSEDFWSYVVAEGEATLGPVAQEPGDETCRRLLETYELVRGPHPDPQEFHEAMVAERRLELMLRPDRFYP